jgi:hypothetical protein
VPIRRVAIVGGPPRSQNCAEQVWPYIEARCLTRTPRPPESAAVANLPDAIRAMPVSASRETVGLASTVAADAAAPSPRLLQEQPRTATALLLLPSRQKAEPITPVPVAAPSGVLGQSMVSEPRRRTGRRAHRARDSWNRRYRSGFLF